MTKISVVINTLNEEKNLARAIHSVNNLADEIIVCDMKSDDNTLKIAKKLGAKTYEHERSGYVEPARNLAIGKSSGEWILILDADEEVPKSLSSELKTIVKKPEADYYRIPRKNIIFGKWVKHSRWWPDYNIRFFKKGYVEWNEVIHSVPMTKGNGIDLKPNEEHAIIHHHYETVEQYLERLNRYTTEHAKNIAKNGYKFKTEDLLRKPIDEFLSRYFQGEGYKDGVHGLALCILQGFSEFVLYLKLWQADKFKKTESNIEELVKEMKEIEGDIHYWQSNTLLNELGGLKHRIKRKLKV